MTAIPSYLRSAGGHVELTVKIVPGAARDRIVGPLGDALKIHVAAPPERGRANQAVVRLLADRLAIFEAQLAVTHGATSPRKTVRLTGISLDEVVLRLGCTR